MRAWLAADEAHLEQFARAAYLHRALRNKLVGRQELSPLLEASDDEAVAPKKRFFQRPTPISMTVAALVIGLMITAMAFTVPPFLRSVGLRDHVAPPADVTFVAQISGLHEADWAVGHFGTARGAQLQPGHAINLRAGFVEVTYHNGVRVLLEGPVRYRIAAENGGTLEAGRLAARVPPAAVGFTVDTPQGQIVDVGTDFGALVAPTSQTQVVVYEGTVIARPRAGGSEGGSVKLSAGESIEIKDGVIVKKTATPAPKIQRTLPPSIPTETLVKFEPIEFLLPDASNLRTTGSLELGLNLGGKSCVVRGVEFQAQDELPETGIQVEIVGQFVVAGSNGAEAELGEELRPLMNGCIGTDPARRGSIQLKLTGLTPGVNYRVQFFSGQAVGGKLRAMHLASGRASTPVFDVDRRSMTVIAHCHAGKAGEAIFEIHAERDRAVLNGVAVFAVPKTTP